MIDRLKNGRYQVICDCCYDGHDADTFADAVQSMTGWRDDCCPDCMEAADIIDRTIRDDKHLRTLAMAMTHEKREARLEEADGL